MMLKVMYWNCRGAGSQRCTSILNDMIKLHCLDLLVIAKPKISGKKAKETIKRINMQCLERLEADGRSGGLWVFTRNNNVRIEVIKVGFSFIHLFIKGEEGPEMACTAVYIYPQSARKRCCFDSIKALARDIRIPWFIIGDFNEIMNENEKKGGAPIDHNRCYRFRRWLNEYGLINVLYVLVLLGEAKITGFMGGFVKNLTGWCAMQIGETASMMLPYLICQE